MLTKTLFERHTQKHVMESKKVCSFKVSSGSTGNVFEYDRKSKVISVQMNAISSLSLLRLISDAMKFEFGR